MKFLISFVCAVTALWLVDMFFAKNDPFSGIIVDKQYVGKRTSTGVGTDGKTTVVTTNTSPEKFLLIVKLKNGKVVTADCEPELYYTKNIGSYVTGYAYKGWITQGVYGYAADK